MPFLHIALQEGFGDERVVVRADGKQIYANDHVKTRTQIGYADAVEASFDRPSILVEVELPNRSLIHSERIDLGAQTFLGVSVEQDDIRFRLSPEPFGYV